MRHRCRNEKHPFYPNYGARGITVCDEWFDSFETFLNDMGKRPSLDHTLDRIDGTQGYSPDNCRWATKSEQGSNRVRQGRKGCRGKARTITFRGETLKLDEWAERLGITGTAIRHRLDTYGWTVERALTETGNAKRGRRQTQFITHQGDTKHVSEWAEEAGLLEATFRYRYFIAKWSMADCIGKPTNRH